MIDRRSKIEAEIARKDKLTCFPAGLSSAEEINILPIVTIVDPLIGEGVPKNVQGINVIKRENRALKLRDPSSKGTASGEV